MNHILSWRVTYTSHVIYCVPRVEITREIATRGTRIIIVATHTKDMHETRVGTNVQLTFVIHQQLTYKNMLNSVHNCESHTHNAFINSRINYEGNGLIVHI